MSGFEYTSVVWDPSDDGTGAMSLLNQLGADGWEAVGLTPRAAALPMPGMGAQTVPEIIVLLKRLLT